MTKYNGMKVLEIDIETAPHNVFAWGLFKQNIYLDQIVEPGYTLCYAAKWQHEKTMEFDSLFINEKEPLFARVWELLDEADAVVHYNGKNFDMPTLNGEFAQLGFPPPSNYKQIDLLQVVRSNFRIASNKMDFVARMFGIEGKVPHKGMDLWKECMEGVELKWGDKIPPHVWTAWRKMELYNKQDVNILSQLYKKLQPWIKSHPNRNLYMEDPSKLACPTCGSTDLRNKGIERPAKVNAYVRYKCGGCGANPRSRLPIKGMTKPEVV